MDNTTLKDEAQTRLAQKSASFKDKSLGKLYRSYLEDLECYVEANESVHVLARMREILTNLDHIESMRSMKSDDIVKELEGESEILEQYMLAPHDLDVLKIVLRKPHLSPLTLGHTLTHTGRAKARLRDVLDALNTYPGSLSEKIKLFKVVDENMHRLRDTNIDLPHFDFVLALRYIYEIYRESETPAFPRMVVALGLDFYNIFNVEGLEYITEDSLQRLEEYVRHTNPKSVNALFSESDTASERILKLEKFVKGL